LAIETITLHEYLATSGVLVPTVTTTANGATASHTLPVTTHPIDPSRAWGTFAVRLYADPNTQVTVQNSATQQVPQVREFHASVSGYLVPAV
jgi:hypothetical protein